MLKIRKQKFQEKFTEISLRQRMYQGESYVTLTITTEFYPSLMGEQVVSGTILANIDMKDIHKLDDLVGKKLKGDIGKATLSVCNDGIWESQSYDCFEVAFSKRNGRELEINLVMEDVVLKTIGTIVFLYTTDKENFEREFEQNDFYNKSIEKSIRDRKIIKYFVKE